MYKRFRKSLKATSAEDSSSDESSEEEKPTVKKLNQPESSTSGNEDDDNEENIDDFFTVVTPGPDERSDPNEGYEEVGIVTEGDLDDGKDEEGIEYRCSLCPRKVLRSLDDVRKHLAGKVRYKPPNCYTMTNIIKGALSQRKKDEEAHPVSTK